MVQIVVIYIYIDIKINVSNFELLTLKKYIVMIKIINFHYVKFIWVENGIFEVFEF